MSVALRPRIMRNTLFRRAASSASLSWQGERRAGAWILLRGDAQESANGKDDEVLGGGRCA